MSNNPIELYGYGAFTPEEYDTDSLLAAAASIGESHLYKLPSGWCFTVEIPTSLAGAQFKVRSEFGHRSARDAILECIQRVKEAVKK
jgi:hypothetical protein